MTSRSGFDASGAATRSTEPWLTRGGRRSATIPAYALAWLGLVALAPIALPVLYIGDRLSGRRTARARLALFAVVFLSYELAGLAAAAALWLAEFAWPTFRGDRSRAAHERLQLWWATGLFAAAARVFRLSLEVEGAQAASPGPLLVLIRHASLADTLLPAVVLGRSGIRLRYVLKRELLWDPCLDVVGQRMRNAFIRRGSGETETELAAIGALGRDLARDEGVLIYPEGTRATPAKRARALERIAASGRPELLERARRLQSVLPPRTAGALALLDATPGADVLVFAHAGLEGLASVADVARLGASGRRVRVALWRVPRSAIPDGREARVRWLYDVWARVDGFVTDHAR
jgi:1-acyl-sn-glycerol-3-phosphate acyltransferase